MIVQSSTVLPTPVPNADRDVSEPRLHDGSLRLLMVCGLLSWLIYAAVTLLSGHFAYDVPAERRPIVQVLCLFAAAFALHLVALQAAIRGNGGPRQLAVILVFAVAFRMTLLFSEPIQEVDIYRYLWDGQTAVAGVDPFRYSPHAVMNSTAGEFAAEDLARLIRVRDSSAAAVAILSRVHFAELTTVYPPVSQVVFAAATWMTPRDADLPLRIGIMKSWMVLFDSLTLCLVIGILRLTARPVGWSIAYGWCPLVLKEFANSGHLDAIAVCLCMLAVLLAVKSLDLLGKRNHADIYSPRPKLTLARRASEGPHPPPSLALRANVPLLQNVSAWTAWSITRTPAAWLMLSGAALGLAVGAKLYPVVIVPLLFAAAMRRTGCLPAAAFAAVFGGVSAAVLSPMLGGARHIDESLPQNPRGGLTTFLSRWEMNDFLFLVLIENVKPPENRGTAPEPWFVIVPERVRRRFVGNVAAIVPVAADRVPFLLARILSGGLFLGIAGWWAWRGSRTTDADSFLRAVFLTLAWFWLLLPTQNPWYWTWALPFVPFAGGRAWLALSGLTLAYYLRFWLHAHWPEGTVAAFGYHGTAFFDFVVTWLEYGPWFVWLAVDHSGRSTA